MNTAPIWLDGLFGSVNPLDVDYEVEKLERTSEPGPRQIGQWKNHVTAIIDHIDVLTEPLLNKISGDLSPFAQIRNLVFLVRSAEGLRNVEILHLGRLPQDYTRNLVDLLTWEQLKPIVYAEIDKYSNGNPLATQLMAWLVNRHAGGATLSEILQLPIYDLSTLVEKPKIEILSAVSPIVVSANERLVAALQKQPRDVYKLAPREFEQLLAELLRDMGYDIELTKQTRDGGADILAYQNTPLGRLLFLVEAKHYREDRKVGVDVVRTLFGTLEDAKANGALLVTTSSFSRHAQEFQKKHEYRLGLRDYADLVSWIMTYGTRAKR